MLTLNHRAVKLPDRKITHRNVTSKNFVQYWIRYKNDWYQVRVNEVMTSTDGRPWYESQDWELIDDSRALSSNERAILESVFNS